MADSTALPELLAPAGSTESLRAALAAGADAVYFGATAFSNRMRAKNFTSDTIGQAIKLCHSCGAKAHITVNTRLRDAEIDDVLALADVLLGGKEDERADALIVADLGVARAILTEFPHAVLHASTQTSMMTAYDCTALQSLGFSRLVVPRELSLREIEALVRSSPIEIEAFIHGAHCVSCSGQCLLSFVMGGRSGNRGECAQPCRLPYAMSSSGCRIGGDYPLSLADMYLGEHIPEIISSGIASLKIEGRLKAPSYVYGVTSIYRRLLDERRNADSTEKKALEDLFTRGFTDGYFVSDYRAMSGVKSSEKTDDANAVLHRINENLARRVSLHAEQDRLAPSGTPITATFTLHANTPAELTFSLGSVSVTSHGDIPAISTGNPITPESAAKNLTKLGKSGFSLSPNDVIFDIDNGLWMPLSSLNELRRQATALLIEALGSDSADPGKNSRGSFSLPPANRRSLDTVDTAEIANLSLFLGSQQNLFSSFVDRFERVYIPLDEVKNALTLLDSDRCVKICAVLPVFSGEKTEKTLSALVESGVNRVLCHTAGQISLVRSLGMTADASFRTNITNSSAAAVYAELGCETLTLSPELGVSASRGIADRASASCGVIGYGRLPVMLLSRCLISGGKCRKGNIGGRLPSDGAKPHLCTGSLTDRKGEIFPVIASQNCVNTVYNCAPLWMGDRYGEVTLHSRAAFVHFLFTDESVADAISVKTAYEHGEKRFGRRL